METNADPTSADRASEGLVKKSRAGAQWLYWIAGISIINLLLQISGVPFTFSFGLGITELIYALGPRMSPGFLYAGTMIDVLFLGTLVLLGFLAGKKRVWAFVCGWTVVALDLLLLVWLAGPEKLLSIAIHVCALVALWRGMNATRTLLKADAPKVDML